MAQNKRTPFKLYALVTQYLMMILVLTIGGFLLGRYLIFKSTLSGGIFATVGAIFGIVIFVIQLLTLVKENEKE